MASDQHSTDDLRTRIEERAKGLSGGRSGGVRFHDGAVTVALDVSGLDEANQRDQWNRIKELMRDPTTTSKGLGAFDEQRVKSDLEMVKTYFGLEQPFEASSAFTNEFLDTSIKMPAK